MLLKDCVVKEINESIPRCRLNEHKTYVLPHDIKYAELPEIHLILDGAYQGTSGAITNRILLPLKKDIFKLWQHPNDEWDSPFISRGSSDNAVDVLGLVRHYHDFLSARTEMSKPILGRGFYTTSLLLSMLRIGRTALSTSGGILADDRRLPGTLGVRIRRAICVNSCFKMFLRLRWGMIDCQSIRGLERSPAFSLVSIEVPCVYLCVINNQVYRTMACTSETVFSQHQRSDCYTHIQTSCTQPGSMISCSYVHILVKTPMRTLLHMGRHCLSLSTQMMGSLIVHTYRLGS